MAGNSADHQRLRGAAAGTDAAELDRRPTGTRGRQQHIGHWIERRRHIRIIDHQGHGIGGGIETDIRSAIIFHLKSKRRVG